MSGESNSNSILPWNGPFERLLLSDHGRAAYVEWDPGAGGDGKGSVIAGGWDLRDLYAHELMGEVEGDALGGVVDLVRTFGADQWDGLVGLGAMRGAVAGLVDESPGDERWRQWEPGLLHRWVEKDMRASQSIADDATEGPKRLDPYERYQLEWMCDHGVSVGELLREYTSQLEGVLLGREDYDTVMRAFHVDANLPEEAVWALEDAGVLGDVGHCWQTRDEWEEGPDRTYGAVEWTVHPVPPNANKRYKGDEGAAPGASEVLGQAARTLSMAMVDEPGHEAARGHKRKGGIDA